MESRENKKSTKWYILQSVPGYEEKARELLENKITGDGEVAEVFFPQYSYTTKTGIKKLKSLYSGYIFVKSTMTDDAWISIRNTQFVVGIIGSFGGGSKPIPLQDSEIVKIINRLKSVESETLSGKEIEKSFKNDDFQIDYNKDDFVEIINGSFVGQRGKIIELILDKKEAKIEIEMFGRMTPTTISLSNIKKISN